MCVMKVCILLVGCIGTGLSMITSSVYVFWILSGDLMYSLMCPQVFCIFYLPSSSNRFGVATGFGVGLLLRCLMGESELGIPPIIHLPGSRLVNGVYKHLLPFRTIIMLVSLVTILLASRLASLLVHRGLLPEHFLHLRQKEAVTLRDMALSELIEDSNLSTDLPCSSSN